MGKVQLRRRFDLLRTSDETGIFDRGRVHGISLTVEAPSFSWANTLHKRDGVQPPPLERAQKLQQGLLVLGFQLAEAAGDLRGFAGVAQDGIAQG